MIAKVRKIGNSQGVILPGAILRQCAIKEDVTIEVKDNQIIIAPVKKKVRQGWAEAFEKMAQNGDDKLLIPDVFEDETFEDWAW